MQHMRGHETGGYSKTGGSVRCPAYRTWLQLYELYYATLWRDIGQTLCLFVTCILNITFYLYSAHRSDNFVIGLTNVSVQEQPPVLFNYTVCGQYPGFVPPSATVSLRCNDTNLPPARYLIVQFPRKTIMNMCELDVCAKGSAVRWYYSATNWHLGDVMMDNITFLWFLLFSMCESLHIALKMYINYIYRQSAVCLSAFCL